jgi:hypothetical protein
MWQLKEWLTGEVNFFTTRCFVWAYFGLDAC